MLSRHVFALTLRSKRSVQNVEKNVDQDVSSILFFGRQIGWEQELGGAQPLPLPILSLFVVNPLYFFIVSEAKNVVFLFSIFVGNAFYAVSCVYLLAASIKIRGLPEQTFASVLVDRTFSPKLRELLQ